MPVYNFELGKRQYKGDTLRIGPNSILLLEGIHGLNPELTASIDEKMKYRVYVSALTTLSIDDHNWIPTTDNRLLRRVIRAINTAGRRPSTLSAAGRVCAAARRNGFFPIRRTPIPRSIPLLFSNSG